MFYVGIDQHKRFSQIAVLDGEGRLVAERKLPHEAPELLRRFVRRYADGVAVLEATRNWDWLFELLEEEMAAVKMSHPARTRVIAEAKVKTDRVDAEVLARLVRAGFLPEAYAPARPVRDGRELHRYRLTLVRLQTRLKNRIHALLDRQGLRPPDGDLFGGRGREYLAQLTVREPYAFELRSSLRLLDELTAELRQVGRLIRRVVRADPRAKLLESIPGIGELSAYLVLYEVGEIERFHSAKHFASYCALVPTTRQSADHRHSGHIGRSGNLLLKWALTEAAHAARRADPAMAALYERIRRRKGPNLAKVAVAHKLAIAVYHVWTRNEPYHFRSPTDTNPGKPAGDFWSAGA
jgi:transposase